MAYLVEVVQVQNWMLGDNYLEETGQVASGLEGVEWAEWTACLGGH